MASFHPGQGLKLRQADGSRRRSDEPDERLAPVVAGAFARGLAEAFEMLGLPAVFLDGSGEVLFASKAAKAMLQGAVRLQMGHLMAEQAEDNRVLASFVADAVGDGDQNVVVRLPRSAIQLRRLPRPAVELRHQLMRAVVLLGDEGDTRSAAMLELLA